MKYASAKKRILAKFVDLMIVLFLGLIWRGGPGSLLGFLYSIFADGLPFKGWEGISVGKRLVKIRVVTRSPLMKASLIRNIPVGIITFLLVIPFWGWILGVIVGLPLGLIETSLMIRANRHQRLGDVMAETFVIENTANEV